ncbi:MAG: cyclic nucleotide-binding domain-containing protein [Anaerolineaceae bacterium]|nr:cyclic nucleotide-binding domain-containing protein [Anaerolineaceae bacterium]
MNISRKKLEEKLSKVFLFKDLEKEYIDLILDHAEIVYFPAEKMVYLEGTSASFFYILYQGRMEILKEKNHALVHLNDINEQFSFGEDVFTGNQVRRTSARAVTNVILIKISAEILSRVIKGNIGFRKNINIATISYNHLVRKAVRLGKEETVCYIGQPHPIVVILKLIIGLFAVVGLGILIIILFNHGLLTYQPALWAGGVLTSTSLLWMGWQFLEWSNDFFLFTDKRIIVKQRSVFSYEIKQETPISAIKFVQVRKSFLGRGLDFGDLEINTFTGSMRLPFVPEIVYVQHILAYLTEREKDLRDEKEKQLFSKDIRERITQKAAAEETGFDNYLDPLSPEIPNPDLPIGELDTAAVSEEIVYHTHWTILFSKVFIPALLLMIHVLLYLFLTANQIEVSNNTVFKLILLINSIILFSWCAYLFSDWRNDVYIITKDQLIDINRRPFGMEEKRAAPIKNIQSIRYERNGVLGLLFNFGTVYTRIGDEEFTFDNVHRPAEVQEALFIAKERFHKMVHDAENRAQRKKAVDWIDSYHQVINEGQNDDLNQLSADEK